MGQRIEVADDRKRRPTRMTGRGCRDGPKSAMRHTAESDIPFREAKWL